MNENKLVTIPREVAEAIEHFRNKQWDSRSIIGLTFDQGGFYEESCELDTLCAYSAKNFDIFISAVLNGYEIEMEPEEAIRTEYKRATSVWNKSPLVIEFENGVAYGIRSTLNRLGIKISGVNA